MNGIKKVHRARNIRRAPRTERLNQLVALCLLWTLCSCSGIDDLSTPVAPAELCQEGLYLQVWLVDPWGRVPDGLNYAICPGQVEGAACLNLPGLGTLESYTVVPAQTDFVGSATAPGYEDVNFSFRIDPQAQSGEQATDLEQVDGGELHFARAVGSVDVDGRLCRAAAVFVALDPTWFAASARPWRGGNKVEFFLSGASYWLSVHDALQVATQRVLWSTWWWQSNFEIVRPVGHPSQTAVQRQGNTIYQVLKELPEQVSSHILVTQFAASSFPGMSFVNTDADLRSSALNPADKIEVIQQPNDTLVPLVDSYDVPERAWSLSSRLAEGPFREHWTFSSLGTLQGALQGTELASWHQKALSVDGAVAFVSGMNTKSTDWDNAGHAVFDAYRMKFASSVEERQAVLHRERLPDLGPRKDYGVRIEGPSAQDVEAYLLQRWEFGRDRGDLYSENTTEITSLPSNGDEPGLVDLQVQVTAPEPFGERSILESLQKAVAKAESFILIEDQYFRAPLLDELIAQRLIDVPDLHVVVVTLEVSISDGGKKWTKRADDLLREAAPTRYQLIELRSFDVVWGPLIGAESQGPVHVINQAIDVHSKLLIVDGVYLNVGSANKNNRGLLYEGEMNVAVVGDDWVTGALKRILEGYLGTDANALATSSGQTIFAAVEAQAQENQEIVDWWNENGATLEDEAAVQEALEQHRPAGLVYPLTLEPGFLLDVGPDTY